METYITLCKIDSQWKFAVWLKNLKQGLCINLKVGWGGSWEGASKGRGYLYTLRFIHFEVLQKTTKFCKVIILQLKNKLILKTK